MPVVSKLMMGELRELNLLSIFVRLLLCVLCAGAVGLERESRGRAAGLRTHVLVCSGAVVVMLTNQYITDYLMPDADLARLGAQVVSGIGFLGAGSIMVTRTNHVTGLATAAGLWASGCLGIAIGIGFYEVAVSGTLMILFAERGLGWIDGLFTKNSRKVQVYFEIEGMEPVKEIIRLSREYHFCIRHMEMAGSRIKNSKTQGLLVSFSLKNEEREPGGQGQKHKRASSLKEKGKQKECEWLDALSGIQGILFLEKIGN